MNYQIVYSDELCHHGIKGQKWGVRRFQNYDGTNIKKGKSSGKASNKSTGKSNKYEQLYKTNSKITNKYKKKPTTDSTLKYAGNKVTQLTMRRKDRAKMHKDIKDGKGPIGSVVKSYLKSVAKDSALVLGTTEAAMLATMFLTGNPMLGVTVGGAVEYATTGGIIGTRISNTVKNK